MKSRENALRTRRFQVEERQRQVGQIQTMLDEFDRMVKDLDYEIDAEQKRTGIDDPSHYAYSTFAQAASKRRDNLGTSIADLKVQLDAARIRLGEAEAELAKAEGRDERDSARPQRRLAG